MPKEEKLVSESEYEGESLEDAIRASVRDIQRGFAIWKKQCLILSVKMSLP